MRLPADLRAQLQKIADAEHLTLAKAILKIIRIGLKKGRGG